MSYTALLECWLSLTSLNVIDKNLKDSPTEILKWFDKYSSRYPISKCAYLYWTGQLCWIKKQKQSAFRHWKSCLSLAEKKDMPYEQALALYSLGKNDTSKHDVSVNYLDQAMKVRNIIHICILR
jgi:hypothetical protein